MRAPLQVLVLIDLVQDLDVLSPVLDAISAAPGLEARVIATRWLADRTPRLGPALRIRSAKAEYIGRPALLAGRGPAFKGASALLTASESTASPHRWGHALVHRANAAGIATFTLQHGLDNLQRLEAGIGFASQVMFCWPPASALPDLEPAVRTRLAPVGRPMPSSPLRPAAFDVGVFENLHAREYGDADRETFWRNLMAAVDGRPRRRFYVRAHPAGGWLDQRAETLNRFGNVVFVSSRQARASVEYGCEAVAQAARVITTPSTVALDAALAGRPVVLALDGGGLYAPLPVLRTQADWLGFIDADPQAPGAQQSFIARHVAPGDAAGRIVAHLNALGNPDASRSMTL